MTDNEIIKALECCGIKGRFICEENCPRMNNGIKSIAICERDLKLSALDLINRQKAEIERLEEEVRLAHNVIKRTFLLKAGLMNDPFAEIKNKERKEFAERLKEKSKKRVSDIYGKRIFIEDIDNLLEEMERKEDKGK